MTNMYLISQNVSMTLKFYSFFENLIYFIKLKLVMFFKTFTYIYRSDISVANKIKYFYSSEMLNIFYQKR